MLNELVNEFRGKKVLIWGFGLEGNSTYNFIKNVLPDQALYICDSNKPDPAVFKHDIIIDEETLNTEDYDIVMKAPGVKAHNRKGNISGQTPLFLKYYRNNSIGVTGTKGKSTTSSLLYHVLKEKTKNIFLVGNIGVPCFDILNFMNEDSLVVFEVSCHQLEYSKYSPYIGVLLNTYEEHLDHYESFEKYAESKKQVYLHQSESDFAIINYELKDTIKDRDNIIWANKDVYAVDNKLITPYDSVEISTKLIGKHNMYNIAIVYYIAHVLFGITNTKFIEAVNSFKPLPHRLEDVGSFGGIRFINDSISTIGQSAIKAIESLQNVSTVLIGGFDRNINYDELIEYLKEANIDNVIFMYDSGKRIYENLKSSKATLYYVSDMYEAVKLAKKVTGKNKVCLLSPAAASYGNFKNFEERGNEFKRIVRIVD